jgi:integrase
MAINKTKAGTYLCDLYDQTGRRIRKTFDTMKEAVAYDKQSHGDISRGDFIPPSEVTVKEAAEAWYQRKVDAGTYRFGSLHDWKIHIDRHIAPVMDIRDDMTKSARDYAIRLQGLYAESGAVPLGPIEIQQVTCKQIEDAAAVWAKISSPITSNKILTTLTSIFTQAQRHGVIRMNAAEIAERLKVSREDEDEDGAEILPEHVYDGKSLKRLILATKAGTMERVLVEIPSLTGMRIGEVLGLQWDGIDFDRGEITVKTTLVVSDKDEGVELKAPKSKRSRRVLGMDKSLAHDLKSWKLACPKSSNNLVFTTEIGGFIHRKNAGNLFDAVVERAGVKRLTFHRLRHTFASMLISHGKDVAEVSRLLGHTDTAFTLRKYVHFVPRKTNTMEEFAKSILG